MTKLLKEYKDVLAWKYKRIPGLDGDLVVNYLVINLELYYTEGQLGSGGYRP